MKYPICTGAVLVALTFGPVGAVSAHDADKTPWTESVALPKGEGPNTSSGKDGRNCESSRKMEITAFKSYAEHCPADSPVGRAYTSLQEFHDHGTSADGKKHGQYPELMHDLEETRASIEISNDNRGYKALGLFWPGSNAMWADLRAPVALRSELFHAMDHMRKLKTDAALSPKDKAKQNEKSKKLEEEYGGYIVNKASNATFGAHQYYYYTASDEKFLKLHQKYREIVAAGKKQGLLLRLGTQGEDEPVELYMEIGKHHFDALDDGHLYSQVVSFPESGHRSLKNIWDYFIKSSEQKKLVKRAIENRKELDRYFEDSMAYTPPAPYKSPWRPNIAKWWGGLWGGEKQSAPLPPAISPLSLGRKRMKFDYVDYPQAPKPPTPSHSPLLAGGEKKTGPLLDTGKDFLGKLRVTQCPKGSVRRENLCVPEAKRRNPGIYLGTNDPRKPYQEVPRCGKGDKKVRSNKPVPGDFTCVKARRKLAIRTRLNK